MNARRSGFCTDPRHRPLSYGVDDCGKIYTRLAEDGDTDRAPLRPLTDADYD